MFKFLSDTTSSSNSKNLVNSSVGGRLALLVSLYLTHAFFVHSDVYFSREPYHEIATNYIMQADKGLSSLLLLDAGYPPVLLRLLSWSVSGLPLEVQPVALGIFALAIPVFAVAPSSATISSRLFEMTLPDF